MPDLNEILEKRKKSKFTKKAYRPWDLSGNGDSSQNAHVSETSNLKPLESRQGQQIDREVIARNLLTDIPPEQNKGKPSNQTKEKKTDNKKVTNKATKDNIQITEEKPNRERIDNKKITPPVTIEPDLSSENLKITLRGLSGIQACLFNVVADYCVNKNMKTTIPLETAMLAKLANTSTGSIKMSVNRLIYKKIIFRHPGKVARGGYIVLGITDLVRSLLVKEIGQANLKDINCDHLSHIFSQKDNILDNKNSIYSSSSSSSSSRNNKTTTSTLPQEWENINSKTLQSILNDLKGVHGQIFNLSQVKIIYTLQKLTAEQVQSSIDHFAYGIQHYLDQPPYNKMKQPAGFLVDTLKNGDVWDEPRYLSPEDQLIKKVFDNLLRDLDANKKTIFQEWLEKDIENKRERFRARLPSNHYFGDNEFREAAWKEFSENEWGVIVKNKAIKVIGNEHKDLINKLITLDK